jgi:hypothetical protein
MSVFDQQTLEARTTWPISAAASGTSCGSIYRYHALIPSGNHVPHNVEIQTIVYDINVVESPCFREHIEVDFQIRATRFNRHRTRNFQHRVHLPVSPRIRRTAGHRTVGQQYFHHDSQSNFHHDTHPNAPKTAVVRDGYHLNRMISYFLGQSPESGNVLQPERLYPCR